MKFIACVAILLSQTFVYAAVKFEKTQIEVDGHKVEVEIADNDEKRTQGLMFREQLPDNKGMLFIFESPEPLVFWMKGTKIPLSIGYYDKNCRLLNTHEMTPPKAGVGDMFLSRYPSAGLAQYAVEMPAGWFTKNKIKLGSVLSNVKENATENRKISTTLKCKTQSSHPKSGAE